jgi:hypothetical protein
MLEAHSGHAPYNYVGEKSGLLGMLHLVLSCCVDAKWAMVYYHDYTQRGFDTNLNGNVPSVTFTHKINTETMGNLEQTFEENAHIRAPRLEPF